MRALIALSVLALAGCSGASKDAERQYEIVQNDPGAQPREKCDAARAIQAAYLKEKNASKYRETRGHADIVCMTAELDARNGPANAVVDNMEAPAR